MRRASRTWRWIKWCAVVTPVLLLALAWIASQYCWVWVQAHGLLVWLGAGAVKGQYASYRAQDGWSIRLNWLQANYTNLRPRIEGSPGVLVVPIWTLMVVAATPLLVWYVRRRKAARRRQQIGHCRRCGYDLTGNVSGVCPECGTAVAGSGVTAQENDFVRHIRRRRRATLCLLLGVLLTIATAWVEALLRPLGGSVATLGSVEGWYSPPGSSRIPVSWKMRRMGNGASDSDPAMASAFRRAIAAPGTSFDARSVAEWRYGLPLAAMCSKAIETAGRDSAGKEYRAHRIRFAIPVPLGWSVAVGVKRPVVLPLGVRWFEFLTNTAFWFVVAVTLVCGPTVVRQWWRLRRN